MTDVLKRLKRKRETGSIPRVLFIKFVHESLSKWQRITGAEQQVAFAGAP